MGTGPESTAETRAESSSKRRLPKLIITGLVFLTLLVSALVFINNLIYLQLRSALASFSTSSGLGIDADLLLGLLLLLVVVLGLINERLLFISIIAAWMMLIPSLLYFSALDWMKAFSLVTDFHDMANMLPDYVVFLNGALLVTTGLLLRAHTHVDDIRRNLLQRGADPDQVTAAIGKNLQFLYRIIAISAIGCLVVAVLVMLIAPAFSELFNGSELAYLLVSVFVGVILVVVLGSYIWLSGRRAPMVEVSSSNEEN